MQSLNRMSTCIATPLAKPVETYTLYMDVFEILLCGPTGKSIINVYHLSAGTWQPPRDVLQLYHFADTQRCCRDNGFPAQGYTPISEPNCNQGNTEKWASQVRQEQKVPVTAHPQRLETHRRKPHCRYPAYVVTASNFSAELMQLGFYSQWGWKQPLLAMCSTL